jgi:hypothetical protein
MHRGGWWSVPAQSRHFGDCRLRARASPSTQSGSGDCGQFDDLRFEFLNRVGGNAVAERDLVRADSKNDADVAATRSSPYVVIRLLAHAGQWLCCRVALLRCRRPIALEVLRVHTGRKRDIQADVVALGARWARRHAMAECSSDSSCRLRCVWRARALSARASSQLPVYSRRCSGAP